MNISGNDKEKVRAEATQAAASSVETESEAALCGPGCDCGTPSGHTKAKTVVSLIVLLTVVGIFAYKASIAKDNAPNDPAAEKASIFAMTQAAPKGTLEESAQPSLALKEKKAINSASLKTQPDAQSGVEAPSPIAAQEEAVTTDQAKEQIEQMAQSIKEDRKIGVYLESLSELNKVAMNQDAVFVFIPAPKNELADDKTNGAVLAAQQTLKSNNITIGLYTLHAGSPDYAGLSSQVQAPAILVASKGKGMAAVSGEVTESKLLQAFVSSSSAGGCGPSGCGPTGCEPTPAAGK